MAQGKERKKEELKAADAAMFATPRPVRPLADLMSDV
jgi:hypothetical protein